jgi:hypothetical protein
MIIRTIEGIRSASAWILNPTRLIDRLFDELERLSAVLPVPTRTDGLARSESRIEARLD